MVKAPRALKLQLGGGMNGAHALECLSSFSHAWIVFVFHLNGNQAAKSKVTPLQYRSPSAATQRSDTANGALRARPHLPHSRGSRQFEGRFLMEQGH